MTTSPIRVLAEPLEASVTVSIADRALADATVNAVSAALRATLASYEVTTLRVVRLRTRKRLARLGDEGVSGAVVVVRVTETNGRHLLEIVEGARAAGALGGQLVWDGVRPPRDRVERHVFAVLERARATPAGPPVVLSNEAEAAPSLRVLIEHRVKNGRTEAYR